MESAFFIKLLESGLHGTDVAQDAMLFRKMRNDLTEHIERVFQTHGVDDEVRTELLNLLHRGETLGVVEEAHALRVDVINGHLMVETQ